MTEEQSAQRIKQAIAEGMTASEANLVCAMELAGLRVLRNGWPDFLVVHEDGTVSFVEAKSGQDVLNDAQRRMFSALAAAGFPVFVVRTESSLDEPGQQPGQVVRPRGRDVDPYWKRRQIEYRLKALQAEIAGWTEQLEMLNRRIDEGEGAANQQEPYGGQKPCEASK